MKKQKRNRGIVELKSRYGYMFTTHWIIGIVIFFAFPLVQSILFSFSKIEIVSGGIDFNLIGIENFKIRINDRRILKNLISAAGFEAADADSVCITFDKLDKIGAEGVRKELLEKNR